MQKVLIIKLGYSETLDPNIGKLPSLGDVLRTTVILHPYKDDHVTWLIDENAYPLLKDNPYINRVLFWDLATALQLQAEHFDAVINLEKSPGICALTENMKAWAKYGFRFDTQNGEAKSYEGSHEAFKTYNDLGSKRLAHRNWSEVLFEMINRKWDNEDYVLGYKPKSKIIHGVGLNYEVGKKWPNKSWPLAKWDTLNKLLIEKGYDVSTQQGQDNLEEYMDWINSCELIVTNDSLGLHLAIALEKKIVALFGPTSPHEIHLYGLGSKIMSDNKYECIPCLSPTCSRSNYCMNSISIDKVYEEIRRVFKNG